MNARAHFKTRDRGLEVVDPQPHELMEPGRPLSIREELQRFVRGEMLKQRVEAEGHGSFEDEDDFTEDEEEPDLLSPYEAVMMAPEMDETLDGRPDAPQEVPDSSSNEHGSSTPGTQESRNDERPATST